MMQPVKRDRDDLVFKALSNPDRRYVLDLLRESPCTTADICAAIPRLNRCTVMQHLAALEKADLVISRKKGRCRWNYLNVQPIRQIYERWICAYSAPAVELLVRLQEDLES